MKELFDSFKEALREESLRRYGLRIAVRHAETLPEERSAEGSVPSKSESTAGQPRAGLTADICCRPVNVVAVPLRLVAGHVGGNVYKIRCSIEEQAREWTYARCRPESPSETVALGKKMAAFCFSVVERHLGRLILEKLGGTPASGSSDRDQAKESDLTKAVVGSLTDTRFPGT